MQPPNAVSLKKRHALESLVCRKLRDYLAICLLWDAKRPPVSGSASLRLGSVPMSGVNLDGGVAATVGLRKLEVAKPSPITERHHDDRGQDGID